MLRWFRVRAARIAATTVLWMVVVGGSAVSPHEDDCHDAACHSFAVEHNAAAHRIGAEPTGVDAHPLHCLVCHWVRAFRPRTEARIVSTLTTSAGLHVPVQLFSTTPGAPVSQPPLRSPPSFLVSA